MLQKGLPAKLGHFGAITSLYLTKSFRRHPSVASIWKSTRKAALGAEARDSLCLGPVLSSLSSHEGPLGTAEGYLDRFCGDLLQQQ